MADPLQFSDLYGANGLGLVVGEPGTGTDPDKKRVTNDAYVELAGIKGFWRKRSTTVSLTAGTVAYDLLAGFADVYRIYYRRDGLYYEVEVVNDDRWLKVSRTASSDSGTPEYARVTQTSATQNQVELTPAPNANFISAVSSTLTLEYFIEVARLVNDSDEPILPANLRHFVVDLAGYKYAIYQGDSNLASMLKERAVEARAAVLRHDLTRTGKGRRLYPADGYWPDESYAGRDYL